MTRTLPLLALALALPAFAMAQPRLSTILRPPVSGACISSPFGPRVLVNQPEAGTYHYGVDLPAPEGSGVYATAPGTVIRVQNKGPGGLEMLVQHDGFVGVYSHFGMIMPAFAEGKKTVEAGEKLGVVGRTGVTFGAHLYFEMILGGAPVDPAPYLKLPHCDGSKLPTSVDTHRDDDGLMIGGRKYYQVMLPAKQYYQWKRD